MTQFTMQYAPLDVTGKTVGEIGVVPWDTEIFGFPVGAFNSDPYTISSVGTDELRRVLDDWMNVHGARLVSANVPMTEPAASNALQAAGFTFVEMSLEIYLAKSRWRAPATKSEKLRPAVAEDWPKIEHIAGRAFKHGRYHADTRLPSELADRRYVVWIRNARVAVDRGVADHMYVIGDIGNPRAFYHIRVDEDGEADLRLAAVDPDVANGLLGVTLYREAVARVWELGARMIVTRISAANIPVMNLYADMGFLFRRATGIFHRHAGLD